MWHFVYQREPLVNKIPIDPLLQGLKLLTVSKQQPMGPEAPHAEKPETSCTSRRPVRREVVAQKPETVRLPTLRPKTLTAQAYEALRSAIAAMPIYDGHHDGHLDERALAASLGISRTPVREALLRLEHEGIVHTVPRRGVYVIRKTKEEIIEVILASAALESMAARLAAYRATDAEIAKLRTRFLPLATSQALTYRSRSHSVSTQSDRQVVNIDEYSQLNVEFHQRIVDLARSELFSQEVAKLQVHMRAIRHSTMGDSGRLARSIVDHTHIIEALEQRQAELVEQHVRKHALDLAEHVREHLDDL